jgi:hypothetical protein
VAPLQALLPARTRTPTWVKDHRLEESLRRYREHLAAQLELAATAGRIAVMSIP